MVIAPLSLRSDYWDSFQLSEEDLQFLYNHLLELETPLTPEELTTALVGERISREKFALENRLPADGKLYTPKERYQVNETLTFPALSWKKGKIVNIREGYNPELPPFDVIEVEFEKGNRRQFAAGIESHRLNRPIEINTNDPQLNAGQVMINHGPQLVSKLKSALESNPDIVRIAGRWFPRALLVDINVGHLNLAEAILDMAGGGPLPTRALIEQIELPTDVNPKLVEFSLNLALQEDERFDEVGPAGEVLWFLKRLEPEQIQTPPVFLRSTSIAYDPASLSPDLITLERSLNDELSTIADGDGDAAEVAVSLIFPHWRAGTLPLSPRVARLFPTALEAPRIQITWIDKETGNRFPGWVVRTHRFAYGLREWYETKGLIPGSLVYVQRGKKPGEMIVRFEKRRATREWIRTVLVGADGGIVYAMLKQMVSSTFDEREAIAVPDVAAIDRIWEQSAKQRGTFEMAVINTMHELAKLTPQGHVHAQELYAAVNIVRRVPPAPLFGMLATNPNFNHVGDMYYRLDESFAQENSS